MSEAVSEKLVGLLFSENKNDVEGSLRRNYAFSKVKKDC